MNIVVINLTRFGDQLQSQAAINALASLPDPENASGDKNRICLVTIADFASSGEFLNNVSFGYPLPRDGFLQNLDLGWPHTASRLWDWREELCSNFKPDLVCNLTPGISASLLGRFIADGAPLTGFAIDEFGFAQENPWAAFLRGASQIRANCPFNIVDLFRGVAGKSSAAPGDFTLRQPFRDRDETLKMENLLAEAGGCRGFVSFQLGASEERRRWPTEFFAALGTALWREEGLLPLLLGGASEAALAEEYAQAAAKLAPGAPHISLVGRTSLKDLGYVLKRSKLLVSNDTGTMHLAAGLGVPVLGLFLATAQAWDTGPYLENCCSLEPALDCHPCDFKQECAHDHKCRKAITPEAAIPLCLGFLRDGRWLSGNLERIPVEERPRAWVSRLDEYGYIELDSISGHESELRTKWFREQRHFLRQFLDRNRDEPFVYQEPAQKFDFPEKQREKLAQELALLNGQLTLLMEIGKMLEKNPLPALSERFISALQKASLAFASSSYLLSLGILWQAEVQEKGDKLAAALLRIGQYQSLINSLYQRFTS